MRVFVKMEDFYEKVFVSHAFGSINIFNLFRISS